ncbi:winged helix-turn-helix domain-containing protein [Marininema halotolerans]|nr:winged helix-turn-helix domain-containing protein [Marininema halotolerans]
MIILAENLQHFPICEEISKKSGVKPIFIQSRQHFEALLNLLRESESAPVVSGDLIELAPDIQFDLRRHLIHRQGNVYPLSSTEFKIMQSLSSQLGIPCQTMDLIDAVWGVHGHIGLDSLYVYIRRLREKIENNPSRPQLLITHHGFGYELRTLSSLEPTAPH